MSRRVLFDLAVNRALSYALSVGLNVRAETVQVYKGLELWYLKTRFAYRVSIDEVVEILKTYPGGTHFWQGGKDGAWYKGEPPQP